ncbi:GGDEF-domain containing protein [Actinoplanes sp. ATCC 53533]|uniref:putative bifunctional diguanylate cyclase/phosphodiesterase n=1 Tax=Actinoplanes sp. ATCC 53533 TaxID=1288362 RepID=UPI000F768656|nr:EAL domain-containing protein [Actinoplanes sp. ATCC 53533]RSM40666.1 GGDEF-domain containing protein [Actinoplanes sp. ATCC 53533]
MERAQLVRGRLDRRAVALAQRWRRPRPQLLVGLLTVGMGAVSAAVALSFALGGVVVPAMPGGLWWAAGLVVLFFLTEGFTVHVRVRRGAHGINVSEFPMVFGLLCFDPVTVILVRALAGGAGLVAIRGHRGAKLAFNVALLAVQASVGVLVFHAVTPHVLGITIDGVGLRTLFATYLAMVAADVVAAVLLTAVIAVHDDPGEWRRLPAALRSTWLVVLTTTGALISFLAATEPRWAPALVGIVAVVLLLAYRAYIALGDGNAEVEQLYGFTRALDGAGGIDDLVAVVLDRARDVLRAGTAELVVAHGDELRHTLLAGQSGQPTVRLGGPGADAWLTPALLGDPVLRPAGPAGAAMAVPVVFGEHRAALVVADSLADAGRFDEAKLRLFGALANHAGAALGRADLVDRLRREAAAKQHLALHDPLSGLPNRRHFQELLDTGLAAARADGSALAVLVLDLDRFKEINDALGHETGDALLREVGERLRAYLDGRGRVARLGGDEFAALLTTDGSPSAALAAAAELAEVVERPIRIGPLVLAARASVGVAVAPLHGDDSETLIRHADVAMYAAKESNGLRLYDSELDRNSPQRLALIADLRAAVERGELTVAYQPKVDPRTGRVVGAEALARWNHPEHGSVAPDVFIPLAEHSGLVWPLTLHVLALALRSRAEWARAGHDLQVAVNLSPNSLLDAALPELVARLLETTGNPPRALTLEITESTILTDPAGSLSTLERLHALGVEISIDDFGTGYSSLGRLRELPLHEVKIDKSFVQRVALDHRDRAVVRSAVQLGHALDLRVVAEGVEDADTYAYLAAEGCDVVQGYLLSRPLPPEDFTAWLEIHSRNVTHTFG